MAIYQDYRQVAVHPRGRKPGQRFTVRDHLPPQAQAYFAHDRHWCLQQAPAVGPACEQLVDQLLADRIVERLRAAQGVLRLAERYGNARLDAACARALAHDSPFYRTVKTILAGGVDRCCMSPHRRARTVPARASPATPRISSASNPRRLFTDPKESCPMNPVPELVPYLKQLRLSGILDSLEARNRQALDGKLAYTEFLALLIEDEVARREQKKFALRLRRAAFRASKTLDMRSPVLRTVPLPHLPHLRKSTKRAWAQHAIPGGSVGRLRQAALSSIYFVQRLS